MVPRARAVCGSPPAPEAANVTRRSGIEVALRAVHEIVQPAVPLGLQVTVVSGVGSEST
ncbi:MAG: hypothetical protein ACR2NR_01015 [Solirubrobacteraceae bacterium]